MTKKEYIANLNSFITHFQDMIKDYDKGKIHPSFDREQAEKDIETLNAAIKALEKLDNINAIIHNTQGIQEDVIRYKMICEVMEK